MNDEAKEQEARNAGSEEEASQSRGTAEWHVNVGVTPLPSAASVVAVHTTNKHALKRMLAVTSGYERDANVWCLHV